MKHRNALVNVIIMAVLLGSCNNFFHELIPPDDTLILSFEVEGQLGEAVISGDTVTVTVGKGAAVNALVPSVRVSDKAALLPVTLDYVSAAFPGADLAEAAAQMNRSGDRSKYVMDLIKATPDFNVPAVTRPIDFTGPVPMLVIGGMGSVRQYTVYIIEDSGEPRLLDIRFSKYDNAELISDAVCVIDRAGAAVYANAVYPVEMDFLSYALIPSFKILGESLEVDGNRIESGVGAVQFSPSLGMQTKTITVTRDGISRDYTLTVLFSEDPDTVRSITDFRFNKTDNGGISANAVASIINTENTGTISVQVYYSGAKPSALTPRYISPGTVSAGGVTQASGVNSRDFSSPVEYRVVSKNGMYTRVYTVRTEFINVTDSAPRITAFRFSAALNAELVQDAQGQITEGAVYIEARYGGSNTPERITPEFSAQGIVTVSGSVQVSGASAQDFSRQVKYTVTNPENPNLSHDYWVQCRMAQDTSSYAAITSFGFYNEDNVGLGLAEPLIAKIDQITGKINVYAPIGSGLTTKIISPRFTAAGQVIVKGAVQVSGVSGRIFDSPVIYTVVSANGKNARSYAVSVRELKSPLYVNCNAFGYGDGSSWENAFTSLKGACEAAAEFPETMSKEIWIAAGTYTPGRTPEDYLRLTANTSYIGGFAGWETDKGQRNVAANTVIISGDLGGGVKAENLFEIPYTVEIRESSWGSYPSKTYTPINGDLSFENLRLENASSYGIYTASMTSGSFTLTESRFTSCGVLCSASGSVTIQVTDTEIRGGISSMSMYSDSGRVLIDRVTITGVFSSGISVSSNNAVLINNSTISNCSRGVYISGSGNQEIRGSTISGNTGCGLDVSGGTCTMNGGTISDNTNDWSGGGVSIHNGTFIMNGGTISGNSVTSALYNGSDLAEGGGVMCWEGANFIMRGGTISGNSAAYKGGGVSLRTGTITKTGGTIYGSDGGANANKCIRADGWGRAVFKSTSGYVSDYRYVDTTLGPTDNLSW